MAVPPQANSLSTITQLASNPPNYPRNPTEQKRESLVLYIARIPGSRDVILTTMKPRLKNVTAEDVLNSLYYFHVDTPNDVFLMGDMQESVTPGPILEGSTQPIARRSLPGGLVADVHPGRPQLAETSQHTETTLSRAPSGALRFQTALKPPISGRPLPEVVDQKPPLPRSPFSDTNKLAQRRPLGPRPYLSHPELSRRPLPGNENISARSDINQQAPRTIPSQSNLSAEAYNSKEDLNEIKALRDASLYIYNEQLVGKNAFSITLIRRDPTSGVQWNVGKIRNESTPAEERKITAENTKLQRSCSSISVKLTTFGYGQFCTPPVTDGIEDGAMNGLKSQKFHNNQFSFDRQVRMIWSKFWERKYKQHGRAYSDQTGAWNSARKGSSLGAPSGQISNHGAVLDNTKLAADTMYGSGFLSPWNGRCDFFISASGRSLKCKHNMPNPTTMSTSAAPSSGAAVDTSELRFNLPSSFASNASTSIITSRRPVSSYAETEPSNFREAFPKPPATSYAAMYPSDNDEDDDDSDDVLDLSLGREKAGGGIRGKRAKLGKLIVHDEGLKMLDLVVAANMGVWWTVWDR